MTFAEFISLRSSRVLSDRLKTPTNTIKQWTFRNHIPRKVWPDLLLAFPEIGLSDLLEMERASTERV